MNYCQCIRNFLDEELGSFLKSLGIRCQSTASDLPKKIITEVANAAAALNETTDGGDCTAWETIFLLVFTFFLLGKVRIYKLVQLDPQTNPNQSL